MFILTIWLVKYILRNSEFELYKANTSDTEALFLDLHLSISKDIFFLPYFMTNLTILNLNCQFPILDDDIPRSTSNGVYISQFIRFARASSHVADFNTPNKFLTQKLLKQSYGYHKLRKNLF